MYKDPAGPDDDIYTRQEFKRAIFDGFFTDYDGFGHPAKDGLIDRNINIYPSNYQETLPDDATHVVWYNK